MSKGVSVPAHVLACLKQNLIGENGLRTYKISVDWLIEIERAYKSVTSYTSDSVVLKKQVVSTNRRSITKFGEYLQ